MSPKDGSVRVRLFAAAKAAVGQPEVEVAAGTIGSISIELQTRYASLGKVLPSCSFLIDGMQPAQSDGLSKVSAGSVVDVLPPFAGG